MDNIKEYLYGKLPWLINNYNNSDEISRVLYERLQSNFNYNGEYQKTISKIKEFIELYKANPGSISSIVDNLCNNLQELEKMDTSSTETNDIKYSMPSQDDSQGDNIQYSNLSSNLTPPQDTPKNKEIASETVEHQPSNLGKNTAAVITSNASAPPPSQGGAKNIEIDSDTLEHVLRDYQLIQEERTDNKITLEGYVNELFSTYKAAISAKEAEIEKIIQEIGVEAVSFLEEIEAIDSTTSTILTNDDIAFSELLGIYSMYKQTGSKVKEVDANVFIKAGYEVKNGIVSIVDSKGTKYEYNVSNGMLRDSNGNSLTVRYYLPSNYSDLSSLNTITCLGGQGEGSMYETTGSNSFYLNDISTNAILVIPKKKNKSGTDINKASFSYMSSEVISGTKFATLFSMQNSNCQNSIIGCSSGGGSALKIAAQSGDLYDNVISVNYAAIFQGDGKGINPGDDNRLTENEARNLNGKNLVFISTSADSNLKGERESYVYKGLNRILNYCPDADVTLMTNNTSRIYSNINNTNYHYFGKESDFWSHNLGNYAGHGDYHKVFRDIINSNILSVNNNTL